MSALLWGIAFTVGAFALDTVGTSHNTVAKVALGVCLGGVGLCLVLASRRDAP